MSGQILAVQATSQGEPEASFLERQQDVALAAEVHEISLPMPKSDAPVSLGGPLTGDRTPHLTAAKVSPVTRRVF